jgi:hypothetical protein
MGRFWERRLFPTVIVAIWKTKPIMIMPRYSRAMGMMRAVVPKARRIGSMKARPRAATRRPAARAAAKPWLSTRFASSRFPAPMAMETMVDVPTLKREPAAIAMIIIGKPAVTAARASVPMPCPMNIRSMKL